MPATKREHVPSPWRRSFLGGDPLWSRPDQRGAADPPPLPDLSGPGLFLDFFGQTLDSVVPPHKFRHASALNAGMSTKTRARGGVCGRISSDARGPEWIHRSLVRQLGIIVTQLFREIGYPRWPSKMERHYGLADFRA